MWSIVINPLSVHLSVREHVSENAGLISTNFFCADPLWPWLGPPPAALCYVMYFRFYGWYHVWSYWARHRKVEAALSDGDQWRGDTGAESDVYECLVCCCICLLFFRACAFVFYIFTARSYAKCCIIYSNSVRLSVCLSITGWYCVKTIESRMTSSSLLCSPLALIFGNMRFINITSWPQA